MNWLLLVRWWIVEDIAYALLRAAYVCKWGEYWLTEATFVWLHWWNPQTPRPPDRMPLPTFAEMVGWEDE